MNKFSKLIYSGLIFFSFFLLTAYLPKNVYAQCPAGVINLCGNCTSPNVCTEVADRCVCQTPAADPNNPFGNIINPLPGGGLIPLLSNVLRLIFVIAGIYAFLRIVLAGLAFIGAGGDPKRIEQAWGSIWQSILGLVIIVASFAIAAIISQVLFGRWDAILNPQIYGPGTAP